MKKFTAVIFFAATLLCACGDEKKDKTVENNSKEKTTSVNKKFKPQIIMIDDQSIPYPSDSIPLILEKAGLCMCDTVKARKNNFAPCDASLFRYFKNSNASVTSGFLVEIRPYILSKSYRLVNIVEMEDGAYKISNDYLGELLEIRTTPTGKYDLVIRYYDKKIPGTVAILHKWQEFHYEPVEVLEINNYYVKPDKKDSLNKVYLENFAWGF
jgi:hypothetical protein